MEILTLKQAAKYLNLNQEVLRRRAREGRIPARKMGESARAPWRFFKEELDEYIRGALTAENNEQDTLFYLSELAEDYEEAKDEKAQIAILKEVSTIDHSFAINFLCEKLADSSQSETILYYAIGYLINMLGKDARKYAEPFLYHQSTWLQLMVGEYLATFFNDQKALQVLKDHYQKTNSMSALQSLFILDYEQYWDDFMKYIESDNEHDRYLAAKTLTALDNPRINGLIHKLLFDSKAQVQAVALSLVENRDDPQLLADLELLVSGEQPQHIKQKAASILAKSYNNPAQNM